MKVKTVKDYQMDVRKLKPGRKRKLTVEQEFKNMSLTVLRSNSTNRKIRYKIIL